MGPLSIQADLHDTLDMVIRSVTIMFFLLAPACQEGELIRPGDGSFPSPERERRDVTGHDKPRQDAPNPPDAPSIKPDLPRPDLAPPPCPAGMVLLKPKTCMDRYEAPNVKGLLPLVMYTFNNAAAWCKARGKRLCFDDEWSAACASPTGLNKYPYGSTHKPGVCNDNKLWKVYSQTKLNGWPSSASSTKIASLTQLLAAAKAASSTGKVAADHIQSLYQGTAAGAKPGCVGPAGVFDLVGNVEEWTRRRDGGSGAQFHGALKGRYWAEPRTCQSAVKAHGDGFRFYEIGFRCCKDSPGP